MLKQIWADDNYVYVANDTTISGFVIIEIESELNYAYADIACNTVWANEDRVFIGTTNGIKWLYKTCISGSTDSPYDLSSCLYTYSLKHGASGQNILYLHGYSNKWFVFCTSSGVDVYKFEPQSYRSTASLTGAQKCFMTSTGKFYYTVSGVQWSLNRVDSSTMDWTDPSRAYITGSGIFGAELRINDMFVTEFTSQTNTDNVIFAATSSGIYVIDEYDLNYNKYDIESNTVSGTINLLKGDSNNFVAIWAAADAGLSNGKFYAASRSALNIIDLENQEVYDYYTQTYGGRAQEILTSDDIEDINVA